MAKTLLELENDVKTKIKLQGNPKMLLHYNTNNKFILLDDMKDLEEGMELKVVILSSSQSQSQPQPQPITSNFLFISYFFFLPPLFLYFF